MIEKMDKLNEELELNEQISLTDDNENGDTQDVNTDQIPGRKFTTLKRDCPTRWNSCLTLLWSCLDNRELIERCLQRLQAYDKIPSDEEWQSMEGLCEFLENVQNSDRCLEWALHMRQVA